MIADVFKRILWRDPWNLSAETYSRNNVIDVCSAVINEIPANYFTGRKRVFIIKGPKKIGKKLISDIIGHTLADELKIQYLQAENSKSFLENNPGDGSNTICSKALTLNGTSTIFSFQNTEYETYREHPRETINPEVYLISTFKNQKKSLSSISFSLDVSDRVGACSKEWHRHLSITINDSELQTQGMKAILESLCKAQSIKRKTPTNSL